VARSCGCRITLFSGWWWCRVFLLRLCSSLFCDVLWLFPVFLPGPGLPLWVPPFSRSSFLLPLSLPLLLFSFSFFWPGSGYFCGLQLGYAFAPLVPNSFEKLSSCGDPLFLIFFRVRILSLPSAGLVTWKSPFRCGLSQFLFFLSCCGVLRRLGCVAGYEWVSSYALIFPKSLLLPFCCCFWFF